MELRWTPKNVVDFIEDCKAKQGVPVFRTTLGGVFLESGGEYIVFGVCYGAGRSAETVVFKGVPMDALLELKTRGHDWQWLLEKYKGKA